MPFGSTQLTVYPTLLWDQQNIILVDCGFIGSLPILKTNWIEYGLSAEQVTGLVLTHHDHDHMGAAAALKGSIPVWKYMPTKRRHLYFSAEKPLRLQQAEDMQKTLPPEQQDFGKAFLWYAASGWACFSGRIPAWRRLYGLVRRMPHHRHSGTHARAHFAFYGKRLDRHHRGRYGFGERPASDCKSAVNAESGASCAIYG